MLILTMERIFELVREREGVQSYQVKLSYMEIYNEVIRDLIGKDPSAILELREDPIKGLLVSGLSQHLVESTEDVLRKVTAGTKNRIQDTVGSQCSSRSHALFQIVVEDSDKCAGIEAEVKIGKLSLIDLAGSERSAKNGRLIEGANINRSLLALGNCINKLSEQSSKGTRAHIPYRDSKLTRLLKDSLGGNCQTVMIGNVSPANVCYEDTHNTLKYASRAKNIKNNVQKNVVSVQFHVSQYAQIIAQLKQEIGVLKSQLNVAANEKVLPEELGCEEEVGSLLDMINAHYKERAILRRQLYFGSQKAAVANFLSQHSLQKGIEVDHDSERLKEKAKLQLEELKGHRNSLQAKTRELPEKYAEMLSKQITFEEELVNKIPVEGELEKHKAEQLLYKQNLIIMKLKEQIRLRDGILRETKSESKDDTFVNPSLIEYSEHLPKHIPFRASLPTNITDKEQIRSSAARNLAKLPPRQSAGTKEMRREKRSNSLLGSREESVGSKPMQRNDSTSGKLPVAKKSAKLQNVGMQIIGDYRKFRSDRPHYYIQTKEAKPSILSKPDKSVFAYLRKDK
eukprot:TRINITY_DN11573_c0_g1_i7.p1 TRINITY_DN11573_c0_g1~~TRINITY_DN11573_c0_g1_i7.p1  ORF type:complete len:569 (-),score=157.97 TRINITY_DN11573_c0_g1_i7:203-1909(-)